MNHGRSQLLLERIQEIKTCLLEIAGFFKNMKGYYAERERQPWRGSPLDRANNKGNGNLPVIKIVFPESIFFDYLINRAPTSLAVPHSYPVSRINPDGVTIFAPSEEEKRISRQPLVIEGVNDLDSLSNWLRIHRQTTKITNPNIGITAAVLGKNGSRVAETTYRHIGKDVTVYTGKPRSLELSFSSARTALGIAALGLAACAPAPEVNPNKLNWADVMLQGGARTQLVYHANDRAYYLEVVGRDGTIRPHKKFTSGGRPLETQVETFNAKGEIVERGKIPSAGLVSLFDAMGASAVFSHATPTPPRVARPPTVPSPGNNNDNRVGKPGGNNVGVDAPPAPTPSLTAKKPTAKEAPTAAPTPEVINLPSPDKTWQGTAGLDGEGLFPFNNNQDWNDPAWTNREHRSDRADRKAVVVLKLIQDSPIGHAYEYTIQERVGDFENFRTYAAKYGPNFPYPVDWSIESTTIFNKGVLDGSSFLSIENVFDKANEANNGIWHLLSAVEIRSRVPTMIIRDPNSNDVSKDIKVRAKNPDGSDFVLRDGIPYTWKKFTKGDFIYLTINGVVVAKRELPKDYRGITPREFKSGAYGNKINPGASFLETPLTIEFRKKKID